MVEGGITVLAKHETTLTIHFGVLRAKNTNSLSSHTFIEIEQRVIFLFKYVE